MSYSNTQSNRKTNMQNSCSAPDTDHGCGSPEDCIDQYPLAMAYVPWQQFGEVYPLDHGFHRGTIFPELDLPFLCANPACGSAMSGMKPGMRGNMPCNVHGNMSGNMRGNTHGNMAGNMHGNMHSNRACNMHGNGISGNNTMCNTRGGRA